MDTLAMEDTQQNIKGNQTPKSVSWEMKMETLEMKNTQQNIHK